MRSQVGTRCKPPMPLRLGSTKRSESFHIGLVKSTMASSRPKIGLFSPLARPPAVPEPFFLLRRDAQHVADGEVLHVQLGQPLEGVLDRQRDEMDVGELVGQHGHRAGQDADRVHCAVAQVDEVAAEGLLADALHQLDQDRLGDLVECLADPAGEAMSAQAQFFRGR